MKRKTKTAVKMLSSLIEKQTGISDYVTPLVYLYRAYGHIIVEQYDKALKDYIKSNQIKKLNNAAWYNQLLC